MMKSIDGVPQDQTARPGGITDWLNRTQYGWLWGLLLLGLALRTLLILFTPQPFGYVYDFYHEGVEILDRLGRLPRAEDCWQGYHPPLYYAMGVLFYKLGKPWGEPLLSLTMMSMLCGMATVFYSIRTLQLYRLRGGTLVLGAAFVWMFPCLFISSWGAEADILLTALMTAFFYTLVKYHLYPNRAGWGLAAGLGVLAGLAAATKYNGLIALAVAGQVTGVRVLLGPRRLAAVRDGLIILALCLAIGGWKYYDNQKHYGTPLYTNGTAAAGFKGSQQAASWTLYDYVHFDLDEVLELMKPDPERGLLTERAAYSQIWTTLHALGWSDMSFFSEWSRHGLRIPIYTWRGVPVWLPGAVLYLAVLPGVLAALGLAFTFGRRRWWPVALWTGTTMTVYLYWALAQEEWSLKTKYILFLLPAYVLAMLLGLKWARREMPKPLGDLMTAALVVLIVVTHAYLFRFAVGAV